MKRTVTFTTVLALLAAAATAACAADVRPAFPGAEGFGAGSMGGRGGQVIKVTNLHARGPGSLQAACRAEGPRIVVFDVSGVIRGDVVITEPFITIAGQTAPGAGITIEGLLRSDLRDWDKPVTTRPQVHDVVVRFLRVRSPPGRGEQGDCIQFSSVDNAVVDHLSLSWAEDETIDLWARSTNISVQWCTLEESSLTGQLDHTGQGGGGHFYGLIAGARSNRISVHHCLFAHHENRNPCFGSGPADFRNNVVYDFRAGLVHHGNYRGTAGFNIIGNYYKGGPSTAGFHPGDPHVYPWCFEGRIPYYLRDNYVHGVGMIQNPWAESHKLPAWARYYANKGTRQETETPVPPVRTHSPGEALRLVLARGGCFPRDAVTRRTIEEVTHGTGSFGRHQPAHLMQGLQPGRRPEDKDDDGMPDAWEKSHGLDADNGSDHRKLMKSGYTAIEEYCNELAAERLPPETKEAPSADGQASSEIRLVEDHQTALAIYYDRDAPSSVAMAAAELQEYLHKVSGAKAPIVHQPRRPMISLGENADSRAAGLSAEKLPSEGFRIVTRQGNLYILGPDTTDGERTAGGGTSTGTRNGTYAFVERFLGVRWLVPGEHDDYVPKTANVAMAETNWTDAPFFLNRRLPYTQQHRPEVKRWWARQRLGWSLYLNHTHNWRRTIPPAHFEEHPE
ncbi:MAG: pectate lyase family protein, partial [Planctomycetota bacterium]